MHKKYTWMLAPTVLLPYLVLTALAMIFLSPTVALFGNMMQSVFDGNAWHLIIVLLVICAIAVALSVTHNVLAVRYRWDAFALSKMAMIVKLMQVPAYVLIFALGVACVAVIWTIPFAIGLFLLDGLTLMLTALVTVAAVVNGVREKMVTVQAGVVLILLQFMFCADVAAAIVLYRKLKRR